MTRTQFTGRLLASVLVLACAGAVAADQTGDEAAAASAGMRVFKDPVTGQFREPTAAEVKTLERAASANKQTRSKSAATMVNKALPAKPQRTMMTSSGGAVGMEVPESEYSYVVVTRGTDGKLHQACAQGEDAATHAAHLQLQSPTVAQETVYETQ
ncbi:hypothetical protein HPT27_02895 [Permianibacter sp. IMCC34836]|uniref:post-PEP-CTERM-1 domain-containing protein n=1 Tax=Permianibacter fluminis TaxID=2738515 RepID=UPI001551E01B|nr:hypothetical protein [Permianibacter fluminis]NQD35954.1 hypothetical protein [Permianibacter fluminis]